MLKATRPGSLCHHLSVSSGSPGEETLRDLPSCLRLCFSLTFPCATTRLTVGSITVSLPPYPCPARMQHVFAEVHEAELPPSRNSEALRPVVLRGCHWHSSLAAPSYYTALEVPAKPESPRWRLVFTSPRGPWHLFTLSSPSVSSLLTSCWLGGARIIVTPLGKKLRHREVRQ